MRTETRHQLKQDKFAETVGQQYSWAVEHRAKVIYGGVAVAVVLALILGISAYMSRSNAKANSALAKAMEVYDAPVVPAGTPAEPGRVMFTSSADRARAAHAEFEKIANEYSRTNAGAVAIYFAGLTAQDLNDTATAERRLKEAVDKGDKDLASLAKLALAGVYAASNRDGQAVEIYKDLAEHPTNAVGKSTAQLKLAELYQKTQPQQATQLYQQIQKEDPTGAAGQLATRALAGGQ